MKNIPQELYDKLLSYLDQLLSPAEHRHIETLLQHDADLKARLIELELMQSLMTKTTVERPSINFTSRVMLQLDRLPARTGMSIRNGIFLLVGVLITVGIAAALIASGTFDNTSTTIDLNAINISKKYIDQPLPSFMLDGKLMVN